MKLSSAVLLASTAALSTATAEEKTFPIIRPMETVQPLFACDTEGARCSLIRSVQASTPVATTISSATTVSSATTHRPQYQCRRCRPRPHGTTLQTSTSSSSTTPSHTHLKPLATDLLLPDPKLVSEALNSLTTATESSLPTPSLHQSLPGTPPDECWGAWCRLKGLLPPYRVEPSHLPGMVPRPFGGYFPRRCYGPWRTVCIDLPITVKAAADEPEESE
ncbi:hypothetical protein CERZMDRAFT_93231 [Cercospora zeae-maydis SCOH1-5]|uniref:Uncharacterized protein n=1 Tax=Cercospora zeae-maydis SCOH1-5 TaxID=717836 RepID=A0A6A6FVC1_9PEZI|nr:hypothetical protein CERZMDRAFT_93231 [Cercospora zeae-maydis SCOH1-5]